MSASQKTVDKELQASQLQASRNGGRPSASKIIELGALVLALGRTDRATFHEDGKRPETDTDHTVMLGIVAATVAPVRLDRGLVAQYALVHDLVEARAGDTNTFAISDEGRRNKAARERVALASIREQFGALPWLLDCLDDYEEQVVPEARYVRYLDKAMPKITHALNACAALQHMDKSYTDRSYADLVAAHNTQFRALGQEYPEMEPEIVELLQALMHAAENAWRGA